MPSSKLASEEGESTDFPSFLPPICAKCSRLLAHKDFDECIECLVYDEPDLELIYETR